MARQGTAQRLVLFDPAKLFLWPRLIWRRIGRNAVEKGTLKSSGLRGQVRYCCFGTENHALANIRASAVMMN